MKINKKAKFILDRYLKLAKMAKNDDLLKDKVAKLTEEINQRLYPKRYQLLKLKKLRQLKKKKIKFAKGTDPRVIAGRINGAKGGAKTSRLYPHMKKQWAGGKNTLAKYGKQFFSHISKERWRKQKAKERKQKNK